MSGFRALLPPEAVVVEATDADRHAALAPVEAEAVARAVEKRRAEFRAGRACAHRALERLGRPTAAIPQGPDRGPVWPDGVVGAITHCDGLCAAAVAPADRLVGIGIDAEVVSALGDEVLRVVTSPGERAMLAELPPTIARYGGAALFSAKESIHKAVHPGSGVMLDFSDVQLTLSADGSLRLGSLTPAAAGLLGPLDVTIAAAHRPPHVLTTVVLREPAAPTTVAGDRPGTGPGSVG